MPLFRRGPTLLPLQLPRLDGTSWPDPRKVGRVSFASSTLHEIAHREAFTPEAHEIADRLVDQVLPLLSLTVTVTAEDAPYLRQLFSSAAQVGAGIGIVEQRGVQQDLSSIDRQVAGALLVAAGNLPPMPKEQREIALFLMQCAYYLARTDLTGLGPIIAALDERVD